MLTDEEIKDALKTSGICAPEVFDEYCAKPAGWLTRFAKNIEQAATRKAIKRPEPGTTEYGSWINTAQKEACRCYFENEQSSRFKWLCAFEQALHRALLPDSKGK